METQFDRGLAERAAPYGLALVPQPDRQEYTNPASEAAVEGRWRPVCERHGAAVLGVAQVPTGRVQLDLDGVPWLLERLSTRPTFPIQDSYNVAPPQRLPVIVEQDGQRAARLMQWGFIPPWSKDPSKGPRPINTKAETAWESPMWRQAVRRHRALIPARLLRVAASGRWQSAVLHPSEGR